MIMTIVKYRPWRLSLMLSATLFANLLMSLCAVAGNISFDLSFKGATLTVTHGGDGGVFYPAVFRMAADGRWEPLVNVNENLSAQFLPGDKLNVVWPAQLAQENFPAVTHLQAVMVRFFDQAGVGFGQISFFKQPLESDIALKTYFSGDQLVIAPPEATDKRARVSWLLWPKEDGIGPIKSWVRFEHIQPPATRIEWLPDSKAHYVKVGAGRPATILLHETEQGIVIQRIGSGGMQGREQRPAWLNAAVILYGLSDFFLLMALVLFGWPWMNAKHTGTSA